MAIWRACSFWLAAAVCALTAWTVSSQRVPLLSAQAAAQTDTRPNVVVMLVDDMGWSDIAPFGGEIATPNLDGLAARGVRFAQFYATPRCSPTRASLLTGLYSHQAGMGHLDNVIRPGSIGTTGRLNDQSVTMAEVLRDAGYLTAMSGKWHLGQDNGTAPWQRGFDRTLSLRAGGRPKNQRASLGRTKASTERSADSFHERDSVTCRCEHSRIERLCHQRRFAQEQEVPRWGIDRLIDSGKHHLDVARVE